MVQVAPCLAQNSCTIGSNPVFSEPETIENLTLLELQAASSSDAASTRTDESFIRIEAPSALGERFLEVGGHLVHLLLCVGPLLPALLLHLEHALHGIDQIAVG